MGEFPKALYSVFQLNEREIAAVDRRLEANRFYYTMNNLLNHRLNQKCNDRAILLRYDGEINIDIFLCVGSETVCVC